MKRFPSGYVRPQSCSAGDALADSAPARILQLLLARALIVAFFWTAVPTVLRAEDANSHPAIEKAPFEHAFYEGLSAIRGHDFAAAGERFTEVRRAGLQAGFERFPEFALILIREASAAFARGERDDGAFLLRRAAELAPEDSTLLSTLATFPDLPAADRWRFGRSAWRALPRDALGLSSSLVNVLLIGLAALTLTALVLIILQICRHATRFYSALALNLPREIRGLGAPPTILVALLAPMALGVLGVLACWSVLMGRLLPECRRLPLAVGVSALLWGLSIPVIAVLVVSVHSPLTRSLAAINQGAYLDRGIETVLQHRQMLASSPEALFLVGRALYLQGQMEQAAVVWQSVHDKSPEGSSVRSAASLNLAALAYGQHRYPEALSLLTTFVQKDPNSFEANYNLALVHLAMLDTAQHRGAYARLTALDSERLARLEALGGEAPPPLIAGLSTVSVIPLLISLPLASAPDVERITRHSDSLSATLLRGANPWVLAVIGAVLALFGIVSRSAPPVVAQYGVAGDDQDGPYRWLDELAPMTFLGTVWFACAMGLLEAPIRFLRVHPERAQGIDPMTFAVVVGGMIIAMCVTFFGRRISFGGIGGER